MENQNTCSNSSDFRDIHPFSTKNIVKGHLLQSNKYKALLYLYKTGPNSTFYQFKGDNIFIIVVRIDFLNNRSYPMKLMNKTNLIFNKSIHVVC